jgi:hypothetical protein
MFGLSLSKILVTILIAVAVWRGFALIGRLARERQARAVPKRGRAQGGRRGTGAIELIECANCGAYFDPQLGCRCGRHQA